MQMKKFLFWESVRDWFDPFNYQRATYHTHQRVRYYWWFMWCLVVCVTAVLGFAIALGAVAFAIVGIEHGVTVSPEYLIGLFASMALSGHGPISPAALMGAVGSVGAIAYITSVILLVWTTERIRPDKVTDDELTELRMLGYIVMEAEDYERVVNEHCADCGGCAYRIVGVPESGQLDTAGIADCRAKPEAEGFGELAEVH
jgi:hypothetical protein